MTPLSKCILALEVKDTAMAFSYASRLLKSIIRVSFAKTQATRSSSVAAQISTQYEFSIIKDGTRCAAAAVLLPVPMRLTSLVPL